MAESNCLAGNYCHGDRITLIFFTAKRTHSDSASASTPTPETPARLSGNVVVASYKFTGNTVFSTQELGKIKIFGTEKTIASIKDENFFFAQLI